MFVSGTASAGVILHEELSTDERPAQRLRPVHPGGQSESSLPPRPSIPTENLLDQMDIYALSPHAAALSLPRMVSPQLVLRAHAGKGTLPPPAVWRELVAKASGRYGLDPRLIAAVIKVESNFETIAESEKGAQGLMQLMPGTQQMLGVIDPFDPEANVDAGAAICASRLTASAGLISRSPPIMPGRATSCAMAASRLSPKHKPT